MSLPGDGISRAQNLLLKSSDLFLIGFYNNQGRSSLLCSCKIVYIVFTLSSFSPVHAEMAASAGVTVTRHLWIDLILLVVSAVTVLFFCTMLWIGLTRVTTLGPRTPRQTDKALLPERSADILWRTESLEASQRVQGKPTSTRPEVIDTTRQRQHREDHEDGHRYCGGSRRQAICICPAVIHQKQPPTLHLTAKRRTTTFSRCAKGA